MIFKKEFPPSDEEIAAYKRGEEFDPEKSYIEVCVQGLNFKLILFRVIACFTTYVRDLLELQMRYSRTPPKLYKYYIISHMLHPVLLRKAKSHLNPLTWF